MLRITRSTTPDGRNKETLLRLEGQVTGPWVEELRRVCNEATAHNGHQAHPLVLDLTGVLFIDANGIALFRELAALGASLTNCSVFVAEQLKEVASADD